MKKTRELSFTGFMACAVLVVIAPAVLASVLPPHWKELLLRLFGILLICFAAFLLLVGKGIANERKKKELEEWENGGRERLRQKTAALLAEIQQGTPPAPASNGEELGADAAAWVTVLHEANETANEKEKRYRRPQHNEKPLNGHSLDLEIDET